MRRAPLAVLSLLVLILGAGCATVVPNLLSRYPVPVPLPAQTAPGPDSLVLYVSPMGNDHWSGALPAPNPERTDGPLKTLPAARDALRALRARSATPKPATVFLRQGIYALTAPLVLTPEDSGTAKAPILYRPFAGESVSISGGIEITNWRCAHDGRLVAALPNAVNSRVFHRLYIDGYRRTPARMPNSGNYFRIERTNGIWMDQEGTTREVGSKRTFLFREGDFPALKSWAGVNAVILRNWESAILPVEAVDFGRRAVLFTGPMKWPLRQGARYYLEGFRQALDAPGEWYCDREAGTLAYIPLPGERPDTLRGVIPRLTTLVEFRGEPAKGKFVEYITFEGITFRDTDYDLEPTGHSDWQAAVTIPAAIQGDGTRHIAIRRCVLRNLGQYALWFRRGCKNNTVEQSECVDLGAGGIRIGEDRKRKDKNEQTGFNTVRNCFIHDCGSVFYGAIPVWIGQSSDNKILHNEICDANYSGISVGWSWGFGPTTCHRNEIAWNHLHHLGRGVLQDMAAIYTLGISTGTRIHHNLIHHIWGFVEHPGAGGIYPDEGSSGLLIENNIVYKTQSGGLTIHYGRDNLIRNNIFAFGQHSQIHLGRADKKSSQIFRRNIVYYRNGSLFHRFSTLVADYNLYWDCSGAPPVFPGKRSLAEWQKAGYDTHSLVADPRFHNPERGDFRLRPDSPALTLGFQPIDLDQAGLEGEPEWTARPARVKRPKMKNLPVRPKQPPRPIFADFEASPVNAKPSFAGIHGVGQKGASIVVTDECAAKGKKSLRVTDADGLQNVWDPHLYLHPHFTRGTVVEAFDLRLEKHAVFTHQWRTGGGNFVPGPTLEARAGGPFVANGVTLVEKLPAGKWLHIAMRCRVGRKAPGKYRLELTLPDGKTIARTIPCNPKFKTLDWCVFVSDATCHAVFYLDNISIKIDKRFELSKLGL